MKELGICLQLTPPAKIAEINKAINLFKESSGHASKKMLFLLCIAKQTGARCGDLLNLTWDQIVEKENGLTCLPLKYKNARTGNRWRFFLHKTDNNDCPVQAFNALKPFPSTDMIFGTWKTSNVDKMFSKFQDVIGGKLTLHRIRVTVVYLCTALDWSDSDIMQFLNWQSYESLQRYRWGADLAEIRGRKSFRSVFDDSTDAETCRAEAEQWAERFKS